MTKWGGLTLALLVGCATGAALRDVVAPARAQGNAATYSYRIYDRDDLRDLGYKADPKLPTIGRARVERGLNEIGKTGWRLVGVQSDDFIFEAHSGQ
jgi:hypothetical protein